ncbi:hypothetical protein OSB04_018191 [Centaurea solstitialis]|uniref:Protein kinase domain-containing protein n=1 Tax=Centaurea solstitialis TaxID=347529 RepID=A0AA38THJ6_9ASTR|nr:hypothetical protein OSB04_018191 [Centaurea solstitialis]
MHALGLKMNEEAVENRIGTERDLKMTSAMQCLFWLFEPSKISELQSIACEEVNEWRWFDKSKMYCLTVNGANREYYFDDCDPDEHDIQRLQGMLKVKLSVDGELNKPARLLVKNMEMYLKRRLKNLASHRKLNAEMEEEYLDQVPGMPTRFSYEELRIATKCFSKKLGEGGFGSVFEGTLEDGTNIAVKRLDGVAQVKKSFLAEVESIGSIHHVILVTLKGFCALKSQPLLVYEFMSNGSLNRWIYHGHREHFWDRSLGGVVWEEDFRRIPQPEESRHLLALFQTPLEEGKLLDIFDNHSEDMQAHGPEVVEMMNVASWCLQADFTRRPSMSLVVKVFEGVTHVESNLNYNFIDPRITVKDEIVLTQLQPSILSGPR